MTYEEIREKFVSGEVVRITFGIRKTYKVIGETRITDQQYYKLLKEFEGLFDRRAEFGGITEHFITYRKPKENLLD